MSESTIYPVPEVIRNQAHITHDRYRQMYRESIESPDEFWAAQASDFITWEQPWQRVCDFDFRRGEASWFVNARLNVAVNCIDRHLPERADQVAVIWEGDQPDDDLKITYGELHERVCRLANVLRECGVNKGDRVCIYMGMVPEVAYAMLACARIGAVHTVVFGGFSPEALRDRVLDAGCKVIVTMDEGLRGGRRVPMKENVDKIADDCGCVGTVLVVKRTGADVAWTEGRDIAYEEAVAKADTSCPAASMDAEDPLFILYTSGSTGKPKGVLHTTGGYLLQSAMTHKYLFDYQEGEVYWCTADVGWITGHSYILYGPLANGATTLMFEGVPTYPSASRFWDVVDKHQVNIFYTAPTAIRSLMGQGNEALSSSSRRSLRILGTVGEPINPEAWEWYYHQVGGSRCPIVDTWWQTETGAVMISPMPGATDLKPGAASLPFFGVKLALVDADGTILEGENEGNLVITGSWPSQLRTLFGNHERCVETYYSAYPGYYFTGDGARRDKEGYYWITGRVDDVINVSGHRMGTAEVESALVLHESVAEAAVVGYPHAIKGQGIYAYVSLMVGCEPSADLKKSLVATVSRSIGPIAKPDVIHWAPALPKTRSGKIMRRILRKIAADELDGLGDTSTLADPSVVDELIENRAAIEFDSTF